MALISLLLALALERVMTKTRLWQNETYLAAWVENILHRKEQVSVFRMLVLSIVPAVIIGLLLHYLDSVLASLLVNTAVLLIGVGCPFLRESFKGYLQAANRGDTAACDVYAQELKFDPQSGRSFGQHIVWINYTHYTAVILWFLVLDSAGIVFYLTVRLLASKAMASAHPLSDPAQRYLAVFNWLPVRVAASGFLVVGNFSEAFKPWMQLTFSKNAAAPNVLAEIAQAAEIVEPHQSDCTEEPCTLLKLAKRNVMLILVVVALLTLTGWLS